MNFFHSKDGVCLLCNKNQARHNEWEVTLTDKRDNSQRKVMMLICNECDNRERIAKCST